MLLLCSDIIAVFVGMIKWLSFILYTVPIVKHYQIVVSWVAWVLEAVWSNYELVQPCPEWCWTQDVWISIVTAIITFIVVVQLYYEIEITHRHHMVHIMISLQGKPSVFVDWRQSLQPAQLVRCTATLVYMLTNTEVNSSEILTVRWLPKQCCETERPLRQ